MRHLVAVGDHDDGGYGPWVDNPPLSTAELTAIRRRAAALRGESDALGSGAWLTYSLAIVDQIARHAHPPAAQPQTTHGT
ncbi:hypothetical protein [Nonomuraea typhae]|uniref:hypothetical protein n=1 Tax=Nonomuraea typhae TaxID=2603600 RepID=UPI0012F7433E|nr:hypothetical protein [Nonomuraea typhae]